MYEYFPLLLVGAIVSVISTALIIAYVIFKRKKEEIGFDRSMKNKEILKRLLPYVTRQKKRFILAISLVLVSTVYSIVSPALLGKAIDTIQAKEGFELALWVG